MSWLQSKSKRFYTACKNGDHSTVKNYINKSGIDVNYDVKGKFPLLVACEGYHTNVVKLLVSCDRVNVNRCLGGGLKLELDHEKSLKKLEELIAMGESNYKNTQRNEKLKCDKVIFFYSKVWTTSLIFCCENGLEELVCLLLTHPNVIINKKPKIWKRLVRYYKISIPTPFGVAFEKREFEICKLLIQHDKKCVSKIYLSRPEFKKNGAFYDVYNGTKGTSGNEKQGFFPIEKNLDSIPYIKPKKELPQRKKRYNYEDEKGKKEQKAREKRELEEAEKRNRQKQETLERQRIREEAEKRKRQQEVREKREREEAEKRKKQEAVERRIKREESEKRKKQQEAREKREREEAEKRNRQKQEAEESEEAEKNNININSTSLGSIRKKKKSDLDYVVSKMKLGEGTFGIVLRGTLYSSGKRTVVAVKRVDFDLLKKKLKIHLGNADEYTLKESVEMWKENVKKEIHILETLKHKNLLKYYGHKFKGNYVDILTEYCSEGTLSAVFNQYEIQERLRMCKPYFRQVVEGLHYLHSKNRDIKPGNVFLKLENEQDVVKIGDVGIAKSLKTDESGGNFLTSMTAVSTLSFTPHELEKYQNALRDFGNDSIKTQKKWKKIVPVAVDVYAMGISFIQVLSGVYPRKKYDKDLNPIIPEQIKGKDLRDFIRVCLKYEPSERATTSQLLNHYFLKIRK